MRILLLCNAKAVHSQRWARALAERGHEVTVASIRNADVPGVEVVSFAVGSSDAGGVFWPALGYCRLALSLRDLLRRIQPDVVNAHYCVTHGVIAALAGARPRVVNLWGSDVIWDGADDMPGWRRLLIRIALENADEIVSTSAFMLERTRPLLRRLPRATIVPFGVDCDLFAPEDRTSGEKVTIGWVKTFEKKYAPDVFLRAAAIATRKRPWLRFVMVGHGSELPAARSLADEFGIATSVSFPGFVPNDKVPDLMHGMQVLVNSSRAESFGVVLLEAAATGLPVISCDVGGVREAMIPGKTGLLVPRDDHEALAAAIGRLADDQEQRERLGAAGREFVLAHYPWQKCVDRQEVVLRRAAGS